MYMLNLRKSLAGTIDRQFRLLTAGFAIICLSMAVSGCGAAASIATQDMPKASQTPRPVIKTVMTKGGGEVPVAVTIAGNPDGRPILFVHGFMASTLNWEKQLKSDLAQSYKLVAVDIRGHGSSGKPTEREAYVSTSLVADDIAAAIAVADVEKPLLVGWSYGGLFVLDYVRHYGTDNISGMVFIDSVAGLLPPPPPTPDTPEKLERIERSRSANLSIIKEWTDGFVGYWSSYAELPAAERETIKLSAMLVPHYVRRHLRDHPVENMDLAGKIDRKTLFLVGDQNISPKKATVEEAASLVAGSEIKTYTGYKSMLQWYNADGVNADIDRFYRSLDD